MAATQVKRKYESLHETVKDEYNLLHDLRQNIYRDASVVESLLDKYSKDSPRGKNLTKLVDDGKNIVKRIDRKSVV